MLLCVVEKWRSCCLCGRCGRNGAPMTRVGSLPLRFREARHRHRMPDCTREAASVHDNLYRKGRARELGICANASHFALQHQDGPRFARRNIRFLAAVFGPSTPSG